MLLSLIPSAVCYCCDKWQHLKKRGRGGEDTQHDLPAFSTSLHVTIPYQQCLMSTLVKYCCYPPYCCMVVWASNNSENKTKTSEVEISEAEQVRSMNQRALAHIKGWRHLAKAAWRGFSYWPTWRAAVFIQHVVASSDGIRTDLCIPVQNVVHMQFL